MTSRSTRPASRYLRWRASSNRNTKAAPSPEHSSGSEKARRSEVLRPRFLAPIGPARLFCLCVERAAASAEATVDRGLRWRLALAQRRDQLAVRADEVDGVAGLQSGVAAGAQADRPFRSSDRDDARLGGHIHHSQSIELAARRHEHSADHEGALPDPERPQHLQAHRGADEPGGCQVDDRSYVFEAEPLIHRSAQRPALNAHDNRHLGIGAQDLSSTIPVSMFFMSSLGHNRHSAGAFDTRRFQRLAHRRVAENHRHVEFGQRSTGSGCSRPAR